MALTAALLLAAGAGSRFAGDTPKLMAKLEGRPLIRWAADAAIAAEVGRLYVVTGEADVASALPSDCVVVSNPGWLRGLATSLHKGIEAARADGYESVVVALGDQPGITPDSWRAVAGATATAIAVGTYDGRRGHPVRLAADVWDSLPTDGEQGAGGLMRRHPELVTEVPCNSGTSADVDTEQDLVQFNSPTPSE